MNIEIIKNEEVEITVFSYKVIPLITKYSILSLKN